MSSDVTHKSPPQTQHIGAGAGSSLTPTRGQQGSDISAFPQITSDINVEEPALMALTSDPLQYGGSPHSKPKGGQQIAGSSTPGRSRLEVVLNVSPYKPLPGKTSLWTEEDLNDHASPQPVTTSAPESSSRKRKAPYTTATSSSTLQVNDNNNPTTMPAQGTAKRTRGRPKGWRPGMPSTKTGLPTASASRYLDKDGNPIAPAPSSAGPKSNTTGPKRRGRPPRAPSPTPRELWERLKPPQYVPFLCEWKGCKAELQNMETLRRHVRKVHGFGLHNGGLRCRWGACGLQEQGQEQLFITPEALHEHMEEEHLVPFVWHVGDGVRNQKLILSSELSTEDDEKAPAYLLGPDGEQVTPWVKGQEVEDFLTWRANRNRLKQILLQRDQNAPFEEEEEEQPEEGGDKIGDAMTPAL